MNPAAACVLPLGRLPVGPDLAGYWLMMWHYPPNVLLILVPLMPTLLLAVLLLLRFSISQMDVPTRQSYTMAVIAYDLLLCHGFRTLKPLEEKTDTRKVNASPSK
jgi:hypothetical protein